MLELRIAEHVADFLKVVRRFQPYKPLTTIAFVLFILCASLSTTCHVCGNLSVA